jgi:glycosyltransferase involved in cell wall biosynthesis
MNLNLLAPVNQLGYGYVGLNVALALDRLGHEVALWPIGGVQAEPRYHAPIQKMMERTLTFNPAAPSLRIWHPFDLAQHCGSLRAAFTFFELNRLKPVERHHLLAQDLVFVSSEWAREVLERAGLPRERIYFAMPGVDHSIFSVRELPKDSVTTFLSVGKWEYRKGHDFLLRAFEAAFGKQDNVRLVMHCYNPCFQTTEQAKIYNEQWVAYYRQSPLADKIVISPGRLESQTQLADLMAQADCGVFLSRAEGWNLEAMEMIALGRPVILTNYSAHTTFAHPTNSHLVEITQTEPAEDGVWFSAGDKQWNGQPGEWAHLGDTQLEQTVEHLRSIHRQKQLGTLELNHVGASVARQYTWHRTAYNIVSVLES